MSDPIQLRALLEQQAAHLAPISARLHVASAHQPIAPTDWRGPAADGYAALDAQLRSQIAAGGRAVDEALRSTRAALGELDG
jgi:hypothetical protein